MALTDSLISYWALDETDGGDAVDAYGSHTLTKENVVSSNGLGARVFPGGDNGSLYRSSNSDLQVGDIDFTVAVKVALDTLDFTQVLVSKYDSNTTETEYALLFESLGEGEGRFAFSVTGPNIGYQAVYANTFGDAVTDVNYCVRGWHDATANTLNVGVDGVVDSIAWSDGVIVGDGRFRLSGVGEPPDLCLHGLMYNGALWKRVLTSEEAETICSLEYPFMAVADSFKGVIPVGFFALMRQWDNVSMPAVGFKGYTTVGVLAFMRAFDSGGTPEPPVDSLNSMKPMYYRRRR